MPLAIVTDLSLSLQPTVVTLAAKFGFASCCLISGIVLMNTMLASGLLSVALSSAQHEHANLCRKPPRESTFNSIVEGLLREGSMPPGDVLDVGANRRMDVPLRLREPVALGSRGRPVGQEHTAAAVRRPHSKRAQGEARSLRGGRVQYHWPGKRAWATASYRLRADAAVGPRRRSGEHR